MASASSSKGAPVTSSASKSESLRIASAAFAPARVLASTSFLSAFNSPSAAMSSSEIRLHHPRFSVSSDVSAASAGTPTTCFSHERASSSPSFVSPVLRFFAARSAASARSETFALTCVAGTVSGPETTGRVPPSNEERSPPSLPHRSRDRCLSFSSLATCRKPPPTTAHPSALSVMRLGARATHASVSSVTVAHSLRSRCVRAGNAWRRSRPCRLAGLSKTHRATERRSNVRAFAASSVSTTSSSATSPQAAKSTTQRYLNCLARGTPPAPSRFVAMTASNTTCARSGGRDAMRSCVPSVSGGGGVLRTASSTPSASSERFPTRASRSRTTRRTAMSSSESEDVPTKSSYAVSDDVAAAAASSFSFSFSAAKRFPSFASREVDFKSSRRMSKRDEGSSRAVDSLRGELEGESRGAPRRESTPPCTGTAREVGWRSGSAEARSRCAGRAKSATSRARRACYGKTRPSCDKTNNGGLREGIARARGFGPGEGVERRDEVTEKGSAHLEWVAYHVVCAVRRVRCAFQTPRQHRHALF